MRAVNLLPAGSETRKSFRREDPAVVVGSALGVIVLIALAAGFMSVHAKVNAEQAKLTDARTALAKLSLTQKPVPVPKPIVQKPIVPIPSVTSEEAPRLTAVSSAMSSRIAWDRILREFSLVLPTDVSLTGLTLTAPAAPSPTTGAPVVASSQGMSITGTAFSYDGVARLLSRLSLIPDLQNVTLSSSSAAGTGGSASGVQFSITAGVKGAPAPVAPAVPATPTTTDTTAGATS